MTQAIDLYELLPVVHRLRDTERGLVLQAFLRAVSEQADLLKDDIDGLWDDLFIETCAEWVIPYIGDLVANTPIYEVAGTHRADVANSIFYRRRKGTLPMLERLARDVTGWHAHAVAMFELLGWTQNLNHLRHQDAPEAAFPPYQFPRAQNRVGTVDVRDLDAVDLIDSAFDITTHTVDVRPFVHGAGWHGIHKVGFFLWRLASFRLDRVMPARVAANDRARWYFSPLGNSAHLFTAMNRPAIPDGELSAEADVPGPIRPLAFYERPLDYYPDPSDPTKPWSLSVEGVAAADVICKNLSKWDAPPVNQVAVDVRRGRLMFGTSRLPAAGTVPRVSFAYGFGAELGGGPYPRARRALPGEADTVHDPAALDDLMTVGVDVPAQQATLEAALSTAGAAHHWSPATFEKTVVEIADSATYTPAGGTLAISAGAAPAGTQLVIQAHDGTRPLIAGDISVSGTTLERLTLNGLVIAGRLRIRGAVEELRIEHCTLVPGLGLTADGEPQTPAGISLDVESGAATFTARIDHSICGAIRMPADRHELHVTDSIVDAPFDARHPNAERVAVGHDGVPPLGPLCTFERSTVLGSVRVRELRLGSESIFAAGVVWSERRQHGCLRFSSYRREGSQTPRRYNCQPDLARDAVPDARKDAAEARVLPHFTETRYGWPAYAQLGLDCAPEIAKGAQDGSEMGTFSMLKQPQRETNLRVRLEEYLPFGLEPGLVYVT